MTRRELLLALGLGSLVAFKDVLASSGDRSAKPPSLFLHACALDSVIGVLLATDIGRHQAYIERLRRRNKFYIKLRQGSTNKYKVPFALDILEYYFRDPDLTFVARVQKDSFETDHGITPHPDWVKVVGQQLHELTNTGVSRRPAGQKSFSHVYLDISSPSGADREKLVGYMSINMAGMSYLPISIREGFPLQTLPPGVPTRPKFTTARRRPAPDNLAQLASFLTGAAGSLLLPSSPKFPAVTNTAKVKVRDWLIKRLGPGGTSPKELERNQKFRILMRGAA
jgi:hypothetical protein